MTSFTLFKRLNFFSGRLLTADDLNAEQDYHRNKRRLHNQYLHGWGVVTGLNVSTKGSNICIEPGFALDCEGNEIVVAAPHTFDAPNVRSSTFVGIRYVERGVDHLSSSSGEHCASVEESFEVLIEDDNSNRGHRHVRGRWLTCGNSHAITIARLRKVGNGWRVDRRYRAPRVK